MLVIRLFRRGKRNQPFFKIVVTDKRNAPRAGRFTEEVGFLNPITKAKSIEKDRVKYWIEKGAKPSDSVYNLLVKEGILEGKKIPKNKKSKKAQPKEESPKQEVSAPVPEVKAEEK